ncbi:MAG: helix-turn-helix domain-containing protein [Actinobacteria bacterium]|nr:helix-turn-helix domain-containing protein [Actinomycetota bacterium]
MSPPAGRESTGRGSTGRESAFARLVKGLMKARGLSIRRLAEQAGVSHSTLSRLLREPDPKPPPDLLRHLAGPLGLSYEELMVAAGHWKDDDLLDLAEVEKSLAARSTPSRLSFVLDQDRIWSEIDKYEDYASTEEGRRYILREFPTRLEEIGPVSGTFVNRLRLMFRFYADSANRHPFRSTVGAALMYFLSAADEVPDYLFPFGYVDDAIAIALLWRKAGDVLEAYGAAGEGGPGGQ